MPILATARGLRAVPWSKPCWQGMEMRPRLALGENAQGWESSRHTPCAVAFCFATAHGVCLLLFALQRHTECACYFLLCNGTRSVPATFSPNHPPARRIAV